MMKAKVIYKVLLVLVNVIACFFFGLFFLGASNNNGEGAPMITEKKFLFKQAVYGFAVSLFFSIVTLMLGIIFRKKMTFDWRYLKKLLAIQFILLITIYTLMSFLISLHLTYRGIEIPPTYLVCPTSP